MRVQQDHTRGKVTKWHKKVGDQLAVGDLLCEVAMSDFIIGVDVKQPGFLARIGEKLRFGTQNATVSMQQLIVSAGFSAVAEEEKELSVGNEIAIIADTEAKFQELQIMPTETEAGMHFGFAILALCPRIALTRNTFLLQQ